MFQVAFSETDGERSRLRYLEFALWIMLMSHGYKSNKVKKSTPFDVWKDFLVHFLEAEIHLLHQTTVSLMLSVETEERAWVILFS